MKRLVPALLCLMLVPAVHAIDPARLEDPAQQQRYEKIIHELRCLKCQGETIADTPAPFAADIRKLVRTQIVEGRTDGEIKQFLVDRYGEVILFKPRSPVLWIMPGVLLLAGVLVAWRIVGQRRRLLATDDSDPEQESART